MTRLLALASTALVLAATTASADRGRGWRHDRRPPPADLGQLRDLSRACQDAFDGPTNEQACMSTYAQSRTRRAPRPMIAACENAFDGDENEQACLQSLVGTRYEPTELVTFCEDSFDGDANELACLGRYR